MELLSLRQRVQTGSGAHPSSCSMGKEGSFPQGKMAGSWSWPPHYMEMSCQLHDPATLPRRKGHRYPSDRRLGGHQSRSGRGDEEEKIDNRTCFVQRMFSHLTDWATPAPEDRILLLLDCQVRFVFSLQMWRRPANIFNNHSQTVDKGWSSTLGIGRGTETASYKMLNRALLAEHSK